MACSNDRTLGRATTSSGPDCSTRCRTLGLLAGFLFFFLGLGLRFRLCCLSEPNRRRHGDGDSKRMLAGIVFGVGMAISAVSFMNWLFP